jgi:hypothetical protein
MTHALVPPVGVIEDMSHALVPPLGVEEDMSHALVPPMGVEEDMSHAVVPPISPPISGGKSKELTDVECTIRAILYATYQGVGRSGTEQKEPGLRNAILNATNGTILKEFIDNVATIFTMDLFQGSSITRKLQNFGGLKVQSDPIKYPTVSVVTHDSEPLIQDTFAAWWKSRARKDDMKKGQLLCYIKNLFRAYITGYDLIPSQKRFPGIDLNASSEVQRKFMVNSVYNDFQRLIGDTKPIEPSNTNGDKNLFQLLKLTKQELIRFGNGTDKCNNADFTSKKGGTRKLIKNVENKTKKIRK